MKLCKCDGEQLEVPTYGDTGKGVMPMICADCGAQYTVPFDWEQWYVRAVKGIARAVNEARALRPTSFVIRA